MKIKICLIVILSQLSLLAQPAVAGMLDRKTPSEVAEAEGRRALTHERTLFQKAKDIREQLALFEIDKNPLIGIAATGFIAAIYIKGIGTATGFFLNGDTVYFETSMQALNRKLLWGVGASTFIGVVGLMLTKSKPARGGMVTDRFLESKEGMTEFLSLVIDQQVYYATMDPRLEVAMDKILKVAKDANASAARAKAEPNANASGAVVLDHSAPPKMAPATTLPVDGARVLRSLEDGAVAGSAI